MGGGGGIFKGRVKKKHCCIRGRGHYMKNKNIGGCVLSTPPDQQKRPRCKKLSNTEKLFLARFAHSAFYKIHISGGGGGA